MRRPNNKTIRSITYWSCTGSWTSSPLMINTQLVILHCQHNTATLVSCNSEFPSEHLLQEILEKAKLWVSTVCSFMTVAIASVHYHVMWWCVMWWHYYNPRLPWCVTLSTLETRPCLANLRSVLGQFQGPGALRDSPELWESQGRV